MYIKTFITPFLTRLSKNSVRICHIKFTLYLNVILKVDVTVMYSLQFIVHSFSLLNK